MPPYAYVKASNNAYSPPYIPVVVVFGGTSGIGRAMTKRLAEQLEGRIRVIVVGRNKAAAEELFASLPRPKGWNPSANVSANPDSKSNELENENDKCGYEFIHCDITLLSNIHTTARQITRLCPKINYLILTSGKPSFGPNRRLTAEGLETQLVLRYYWKFAIIHDLLPNLHTAREEGEAAGVFVVLGGGFGPKIDFTDLGMEKRYWWGVGPIWWGVSYGDLMLSMYAERNPTIAFTHMYPGMVNTPANSPSAVSFGFFKFLLYLIRPIAWLFFIKVEVSAENMVYGLINGEQGLYMRWTKGDDVAPRNVAYSERDKEVFWEHSVRATRV